MNEITDLITFLRTRIKKENVGDKTTTEKTEESLTQTQEQSSATMNVGDKQTSYKTINVLPQKEYNKEQTKNIVGGKMLEEKPTNFLPQNIILRLNKPVWIKRIETSKNVVVRGKRRYYYIRKRVDLPRDFNDEYAVIMRREDFVDLIKTIAEALGVKINNEKIQELFNM